MNCPEKPGEDTDIGASPILVSLAGGKRLLLVGQKSGVMWALDPDAKGNVVWQQRIGKGGVLGGIMFGPAADAEKVYVPLSDFTMRGPTEGGDPKLGGGLFALRIADRRESLVRAARGTQVHRDAGMHARANGARHADSRRGLLRLDGRPSARL